MMWWIISGIFHALVLQNNHLLVKSHKLTFGSKILIACCYRCFHEETLKYVLFCCRCIIPFKMSSLSFENDYTGVPGEAQMLLNSFWNRVTEDVSMTTNVSSSCTLQCYSVNVLQNMADLAVDCGMSRQARWQCNRVIEIR